jgi:hypothetical protein
MDERKKNASQTKCYTDDFSINSIRYNTKILKQKQTISSMFLTLFAFNARRREQTHT